MLLVRGREDVGKERNKQDGARRRPTGLAIPESLPEPSSHLLKPRAGRGDGKERNDVRHRGDVHRKHVEVIDREWALAGEHLEALQEKAEEGLHFLAVVLLECRRVALSDALQSHGGVLHRELTDDLLEIVRGLGHGKREWELGHGRFRLRVLCLRRLWLPFLILLL